MTSKLKCPVCEKDLIPMTLSSNDNGTLYSSVAFPIKDCICNTSASKKIWQALIQSQKDRKELAIKLAQTTQNLEQSEKCCSAWETQALDYKAETIALSGKLGIAQKALEHCIKTFRQLEAVLDEKANARDFDDPDLYAWAVRIKPIWLELKEITGTDYKTENK